MSLSFRQVKLKGAMILGLSFVFDVSIPLFSPFDWENTLWSCLGASGAPDTAAHFCSPWFP